ncbi:lipopolysaccharide transport periplasmic protein LptA [Gammaproteobacteria bacterium 53_120_T64]|nr:lipopolysaccharide transport periplasmic protein LptA [Gammaproteobacteria bacterium 53_120_T64]
MPTIKLPLPVASLLCLLAAMCHAGSALALPSDRQATITVEADRATINEKTGITEYQGAVVIQQGSLLIEAEQVTIYATDGQAHKIICIGKPAHYQQRPNVEDGLVNAHANTIEYYLDTDVITLIKNASLEQQGSTLRGDHINYDLKAELVVAKGSANSQQRVHMVIPASQPVTQVQSSKAPAVEPQATHQAASPEASSAPEAINTAEKDSE